MKRKRIRLISLALAICMVAGLAAGCSGQKETGSSDAGTGTGSGSVGTGSSDSKVTITLLTRYAGSDPQAPWLKEMMNEFVKIHPNVTFQDDSVADEAAYNNKLKTAIATGNLPNMWIQYGAAPLVQYAKNGLLMDMSFLLQDKEFTAGLTDKTLSTFNLSSYGVNGIYALPFAMEPEVIFYNKDLFKKAGIDKVPETMDDMYAAIGKLKAAGITPMGMGAKDSWRLGHFFNCIAYREAGIDTFKNIGARKAKWTDPEVVKCLETLKGFEEKGAFEDNFEGIDWSTESANFLSGKYGITCVPLWFIPTVESSKLKDSIDFFPIPYFTDEEQYKSDSTVYVDALVYSGKLQGYEKEITQEWAKFTQTAASEEVRLKVCGQIPGRTDVNLDGVQMSPLLTKAVGLNKTLTKFGGDTFEFDSLNSMQDVTRNALIGMMLGTSPQETAATIQAKIDNNK